MGTHSIRGASLFAIALCLNLCGVSEARSGAVDFLRFVVVGDSLAAGQQNFSLHENFQPHSYANLIAIQAGANLRLPLIAAPGIPNALTLLDPGPPPVLGQEPGISAGRIDPFTPTMNVSIPNLKINEVLNNRPSCTFAPPPPGELRIVDLFIDLILGLPFCYTGGPLLSEVEMAEMLAPTFVVLWIGNNDTLWAAIKGTTSELTSPAVFAPMYEEIVNRLSATGAKIVIGNLPDVTTTAFLTSAEKVAEMVGSDLSIIGPILGIGPGDYVTLFAFDYIKAILSGMAPPPLPDSMVVSASELADIQATNLQLNNIVTGIAASKNIPVADIRGLLDEAHRKGEVVNGQRLTTNYLGGIFTLDGFHPTDTGHALTANEFIKTINRFYGTGIPDVDVSDIMATDPLVFPTTGRPPKRSQTD